jgi:hypothetical protein
MHAMILENFDEELERHHPDVALAVRRGSRVLILPGAEFYKRMLWRDWHRYHEHRWSIDVRPAWDRRRYDRVDVCVEDRLAHEVARNVLDDLKRRGGIARYDWYGAAFIEDGGLFVVRVQKGRGPGLAQELGVRLNELLPAPAEKEPTMRASDGSQVNRAPDRR